MERHAVRRARGDVDDARAAALLEQAGIGVDHAAHVGVVAACSEVAYLDRRWRQSGLDAGDLPAKDGIAKRLALARPRMRERAHDDDVEVRSRARDLGGGLGAAVGRDRGDGRSSSTGPSSSAMRP